MDWLALLLVAASDILIGIIAARVCYGKSKNSNFLGGVTMTKIIDLSVKEKIYESKKAQISILNDFKLEVADGEKSPL